MKIYKGKQKISFKPPVATLIHVDSYELKVFFYFFDFIWRCTDPDRDQDQSRLFGKFRFFPDWCWSDLIGPDRVQDRSWSGTWLQSLFVRYDWSSEVAAAYDSMRLVKSPGCMYVCMVAYSERTRMDLLSCFKSEWSELGGDLEVESPFSVQVLVWRFYYLFTFYKHKQNKNKNKKRRKRQKT